MTGKQRLPRRPLGINRLSGGERRSFVDMQKGVGARIESGDPIQRGLRALHRSQVAVGNGSNEVDRGEFEGLHGLAWLVNRLRHENSG